MSNSITAKVIETNESRSSFIPGYARIRELDSPDSLERGGKATRGL
ncbi:MAG: hypothetical protein ACLFM4_06715 [Phormidium sp.]